MTVKKLIELLELEPPTNEVSFGGLDFYRLKDTGDITHVEFNQTVSTDSEGNVLVQNH